MNWSSFLIFGNVEPRWFLTFMHTCYCALPFTRVHLDVYHTMRPLCVLQMSHSLSATVMRQQKVNEEPTYTFSTSETSVSKGVFLVTLLKTLMRGGIENQACFEVTASKQSQCSKSNLRSRENTFRKKTHNLQELGLQHCNIHSVSHSGALKRQAVFPLTKPSIT